MSSFSADLKKRLIDSAMLALPIALIDGLVIWLMSRFSSQPWQVLLFVIPLVVLGVIVWKKLTAPGTYVLGKPFTILLAVFILVFSLIAGTEFLNWRRDLGGYERQVPRNFLSLNWAGDWRYWLVTETPPATDLAVVTMEPPASLDRGRMQLADFINQAVKIPVKGIAVDAYFDEPSRLDPLLCREAENAKKNQIPIFVGYNFELSQDATPGRKIISPGLSPCLPNENQGHLVGYYELDGKVRIVPLYFANRQGMESLSLKVSKTLNQNVQVPQSGLLQFVKPAETYPEVKLEGGPLPAPQQLVLRDRFVLVGVRSEKDSFNTAYGRLPGVVIHSFVVHSLRQNHYLQRIPWWSSLIAVFVSCYLVTLFFARGWTTGKAFLMTMLISAFIVLLAIIGVAIWRLWIDVIYPLLAVWLLFLILTVLRRRFEKPAVAPSEG